MTENAGNEQKTGEVSEAPPSQTPQTLTLWHWLLIIAGIPGGLFTRLTYGLFAGLALLFGYAACHRLRWPGLQLCFAYLFGGLCTGAGLQVLAGFGIREQLVPMFIAPLLLWLATRVIFTLLEERYSLTARRKFAPSPPPTAERGVSAWSGSASGGSTLPDHDGSRVLWRFYDSGEICMGGPTFGDVVFTNGCAFQGVGPSVAIADDGRYAAMTLPSRDTWGMLLVDFEQRLAYHLSAREVPWEIDAISDGRIQGRISPLTGDTPVSLAIDQLVAEQEAIPLVQDDGWWLLDDAHRRPLPTYDAVSVSSSGGNHTLTFVPDRRPFRDNPFRRFETPSYALLVDRCLLDLETRHTRACWIDTQEQEGRFLVVGDQVLDLMPDGIFDPAKVRLLPLSGVDDYPHAVLGPISPDAPGALRAEVVLLQRSTAFDRAESCGESSTHPWDEEEIVFRDSAGRRQRQHRTRVGRHAAYRIDLLAYVRNGDLRLATAIELKNRACPDRHAELHPLPAYGPDTPYAPYRCVTSCGIDPGPVIGEFAWSHCGRYLALVVAEAPPAVPGTIRLIDFELATQRDLPGYYPLPGFLWFSAEQLDFTFLCGICESVTEGPGKFTERRLLLSDPAHADAPHELLFGGIAARRQSLFAACRLNGGHASVQRISRHGMLFAPDFDRPVWQGAEEDT